MTELEERIAHPAAYAAADDAIERELQRLAVRMGVAMQPPSAPAATLQQLSIRDMLDQGYRPAHVARIHDVELRVVEALT